MHAYFDSFPRFGKPASLVEITALMHALGDPQNTLRFVHVAGTNGKGSITTMVASVFRAAGHRVGLYTSPYIVDFAERIQVDGVPVSPADLDAAVARLAPAVDRLRAEGYVFSQFDVVTAAAFLHFAAARCDIVALEVGLGGRFDATNVIATPDCAVIAPIGLDHCGILGNTIPEIAFEKAGIIKPGGDVVLSPRQPDDALPVFYAAAAERGAVVHLPSIAPLCDRTLDPLSPRFTYAGEDYTLSLLGAHQLDNAVTVLEVVRVLRGKGWRLPDSAVHAGLAAATLPARLQILSRDPLVLLDGAHNPHGAAALAAFLPRLPQPLVLVMGMCADKDAAAVVSLLAPHAGRAIAVPLSNPRALPPEEMRALLARHVPTYIAASPAEGIARAKTLVPGGTVVVCGSLFLCGDVLRG